MKIPTYRISFLVSCLIAAPLGGCAPQLLRNPATNEVATCRVSGVFAIANRTACVADYEAKGWIQTTQQEEESRARAQSKNQAMLDERQKDYEKCVLGAVDDPSLQVIAGKVSLAGAKKQTFSMLTDNTKPTEEEKSAIGLYANIFGQCAEKLQAFYNALGAPPAIAAVNQSAKTAEENLLASLYTGALTYGDYAKRRKEIVDSREMSIAQIDQELKKNAADASARAQEIAAHNAIAQAQRSQAISSSMMVGATMANAFKPTRSSMSCTSTALGSTLRTNCY